MQEAEAEGSQIQGLQNELKGNLKNLVRHYFKLKRWNVQRSVSSSTVDHLSNVRKTVVSSNPWHTRSLCSTPFPLFTTKDVLSYFLSIKCKVKSLYLSSILIYIFIIIFRHESRNKCILLWDPGHLKTYDMHV